MTERYLTAADLAEDLRGWQAPSRSPDPLVPGLAFKGLRPFDDDDADLLVSVFDRTLDESGARGASSESLAS